MKIVSDAANQIVKVGKKALASASSKPKLSRLSADTVELSHRAERFVPDVFKGSDVPMHHEINGLNHEVRLAAEYLGKDLPKTDRLWYKMKIESGKEHIKSIDAAFKKLKPLEKDCIVYRGRGENPMFKSSNADFDIIANAKVGDIIVPDTGYSYTAFHKSLAEHWHSRFWTPGGEKEKRVMMMEIHLPKGSKVSRNLEHGGEVVMPRNAKYELVSKRVNEKGDMDVVLKYIPEN